MRMDERGNRFEEPCLFSRGLIIADLYNLQIVTSDGRQNAQMAEHWNNVFVLSRRRTRDTVRP